MTGSGTGDKPRDKGDDATAPERDDARCASTRYGTRCELAKGHAGPHEAHGVWMVRTWE